MSVNYVQSKYKFEQVLYEIKKARHAYIQAKMACIIEDAFRSIDGGLVRLSNNEKECVLYTKTPQGKEETDTFTYVRDEQPKKEEKPTFKSKAQYLHITEKHPSKIKLPIVDNIKNEDL